MAHARGNLVRRAEANEELAVTGRRHRAGGVVGIDAGADDRGVADPARQFAGHAAGRGRRGEIAGSVARHRAHRAVAARLVDFHLIRKTAPLPFQLLLQLPPAALGMEILALGEG